MNRKKIANVGQKVDYAGSVDGTIPAKKHCTVLHIQDCGSEIEYLIEHQRGWKSINSTNTVISPGKRYLYIRRNEISKVYKTIPKTKSHE